MPTSRLHAAAASFWREWHRELRRHAGDERLPYQLRVTLRGASDRALERAGVADGRAIVPRWNRQAVSIAPPVRLSPADEARARRLAAEQGMRLDQPMVAVEAGHRADLFEDAGHLLSREGYSIVHIGDRPLDPLVERYIIQTGVFVVCRSVERQLAAVETHTPSLRLDARDPFTAYPIRPDGVFTLATVIDLDTGRTLETDELLTERYFRNTRNCGYRGTSAAEVAAAVAEMIDGVRHGWHDRAAQTRFRQRVTEAGAALGARVRHLVEWDAAGGFVGDGRLAAVQAERTQ